MISLVIIGIACVTIQSQNSMTEHVCIKYVVNITGTSWNTTWRCAERRRSFQPYSPS